MRRSDSIASSKAPPGNLPPNVVVIGEMGVGKTDWLMTGIHSLDANNGVEFQHFTNSTIQFDYFPTTRRLTEGRTMRLNFIDTAGQEKFQVLVHSMYRNAAAFVLMYDVNDAASFLALQQRWYPDAWKYYEDAKRKPIWFIVGTKTDLHSAREVDYKEAEKYAAAIDAFVFETNTREGKGARARHTLDLIAAVMARHGVPCDAERAAAVEKTDIISLTGIGRSKTTGKCKC